MLRAILNAKQISLYRLEKNSHISHATLNDIYNERSNIDNCTVLVMSKIAKALNMSTDDLYSMLAYNDLSLFAYDDEFDLFKSNALQQLKRIGEKAFIKNVLESSSIESLYKDKKYLESLYLLSLLDYLFSKNKKPLLKQYDSLRSCRLNKIYVSKSIYLLLIMKRITVSNIYKESIKEFLVHNIVEANINDVV